MKKSTLTAIVVSFVLIIAGALICIGALAASNFDIHNFETLRMEEKTDYVTEEFSSINIDTTYYNVRFCVSADGQTKVVRREDELSKYDIKSESSVLYITYENNRKWYDYIGISFGDADCDLTVYLPEARYHELVVKSSSGDVTVGEGVVFDTVKIETSSGDVEYSGSESSEISVKTTSGDVDARGISVNTFSVSANSGEVNLKNINSDGAFSASTLSGDIEAEAVRCKTFSCASTSGDIELDDVISTEILTSSSTSGDVFLKNCDGGSIVVETSSGDVLGSIMSEKVYIVETVSGDIKVPDSFKDSGECKIKTTSGDIKISASH